MLVTDLNKLLADLRRRSSDHADVEVKRARNGLPQDLWESLSAFANADGGLVILGVDEKTGFSVTGVENAGDTEQNLGSLCQDMEPPIRAVIATTFIEGQAVVTAAIPAAPRDRRPCHRRAQGPYQGSRIRVADGNRKLTEYEVGILLANQREPMEDHLPVAEATERHLSQKALTLYFDRLRRYRPSAFGNRTDAEILSFTNVITEHHGAMVPTLAGLLAFGTYPQQFFPQLHLSIVRYPTPAPGEPGPRGERFIDSLAIDGAIPQILTDAMAALRRNMQRRSIIMGLFRQDEWEYPEVALREALVNALVHRDLAAAARGTQVQVEMYPDRLVVRNAGGLYGPTSVRDLGLTGTSSSRNRAFLKMLGDTAAEQGHTVCENAGSGIFSMRQALTAAGMESPEFRDNISTFEVVIPNHALLDRETLEWMSGLGVEGLSSAQMSALALVRRGQPLTNTSFRAATGVMDSREAGRLLKELVDQGLLDLDGRGRSSVYRLAGNGRGATPALDVGDTEPVRAILTSLAQGPLTRSEIEKATGLPKNTVNHYLRRLRESDRVRMHGSERSRTVIWEARSEQA